MAEQQKNNTDGAPSDELYYKNKVLSFMRASTSRDSYIKYQMLKCYSYFEGKNNNNPYKTLTNLFDLKKKSNDGVQTLKIPTIFTDLNHINPKIRALEGELIGMGFKAHVESINKEAKSRKLEFKTKLMTEMAMKPYFEHAAVETGIDIGIEENLPIDANDLEQRFKNNTYKDISDKAMDACLKYSLMVSDYYLMRLEFFRDAIISGECHGETYVSGSGAYLRRLNPLNVYYTVNPNDDDFLSKTNGKGVIEYCDINDVMNQYNLTPKQIEIVNELAVTAPSTELYTGILMNGLNYFQPFLEDKKHVLVVKWKWTDSIEKAGVEITYADGRTEFRVVNIKDKNRITKKTLGIPEDSYFKITRKKITTLFKCTLIGGELVIDYGEEKNLIREYENISMAICPIVSYRPYYINGSSMSEVAKLTSMQDLRNYIMTQVTLEITKSGGNALAVDVSKLPKEWGASPADKMGKVLHYLKGFGIIPYNSAEGEALPGQNSIPVQRFDAGIGSALTSYVAIMQLLESEMDKISGINGARLGQIQSANQLKGVTELALSQSSTITRYLYKGFFSFESKLLTYHCQHIKMVWITYPEKYTPVIGDFYFDFLKQDVDITMDTHAARVEPDELSFETLQSYLMMAVQANALPLDEALEIQIKGVNDVRGAVDEYIKKMQERREQDREDKMAMQEQQLQAQQQQAQMVQQSQQEMLQQQQNAEYKKQQLKSLADIQKKNTDSNTKKYIEQMKILNEKAV